MKYLIIGLGNPGSKYDNTRHNIGFNILDALAKASNIEFKSDRLGERAKLKHKGRSLWLIKPTTFMNLSGKAVNYWIQKEKISIDNLLVITDDISLAVGQLRLKPKGSNGGHNGLKSIQESIGTQEYSRLRFGVGNNFNKGKQSEHVLGLWKNEEIPVVKQKILLAIEVIESFCAVGLDITMNSYNNR